MYHTHEMLIVYQLLQQSINTTATTTTRGITIIHKDDDDLNAYQCAYCVLSCCIAKQQFSAGGFEVS